MSVSFSRSLPFSQNQQANPVKENGRAAKNDGCAAACTIGIVALIALAIIGVFAAGITLTTLGAVTANPVFLNVGICLLVGGVLGLVKAVCLASCRS